MQQLLKVSLGLNIVLLGLGAQWIAKEPGAAVAKVQQAAAAPFDWSRIEADDFVRYADNLRAIGCPEATIRRLITAEVQDTARADAKAASSTAAAPGIDQKALIESFLRPVAAAESRVMIRAEIPAVMPLVFQVNEPGAECNDPAAQAALDQLRREFLENIGGADQNPDDPQYARRWKRAQSLADQQTQAMLGTDLTNQLQMKAGQESERR